ncbi:excinuclease ABC subunit UvrC [Celerinatantimonas diazotrophica]|uniref:UvrABC system protein C n=1 Tax=Celerinatantimonas diazotrophica TaxID=412034 RepID=A0A4R1KGV1_9GAMM|nr:excinuclease ABC subunit UvrC [Celerinatantimonas diazotrophica]TCK63996.1 excinuclease ABC subunit C [Celerinatantimonas diazotrophica]CAG9297087.1 UvrABC system protein C [Celerinatantimonas diazotrophica]
MSEFDAAAFLNRAPALPGVYRMYDSHDKVIYVGKAKSLKKRLSSYFRKRVDRPKTAALVRQIAYIETTITNSETEALILEHNLIKKYRPRYNVVLRDDKSYPYILLSAHRHPRLALHRGHKRAKGKYFGPYPSGKSVRESLILLQKTFPIRQCRDSEYANRTRPCLQYQIGRCSGPCCDKVSDEEYRKQADLVALFLSGKGDEVIERLVNDMEQASCALEFEKAASYRDQIQALRRIQEQQWVSGTNATQTDVVGFDYRNGIASVHLMLFREGQLLGSRSYYPKVPKDTELSEVLQGFVTQYYLAEQRDGQLPKEILVGYQNDEWQVLQQALSERANHQVQIHNPTRGEKVRLLKLANDNAQNAVTSKLLEASTAATRLAALQHFLAREEPIRRMECFDISHTQGERTVASCVVFDQDGPKKSAYRRFNIDGITGGDDYAAMAQALKRRYGKQSDDAEMPDILFIDGGKGQLSSAFAALDELQLANEPLVVGVAKGVTRKPGLETLLIGREQRPVHLEKHESALHLIQYIRDESHRFAITGHRNRRDKARQHSFLEEIPGIGAKRRQSILKFMGGIQEVKRASADELAKVPGISKSLAQTIVDRLQE